MLSAMLKMSLLGWCKDAITVRLQLPSVQAMFRTYSKAMILPAARNISECFYYTSGRIGVKTAGLYV